MSFRLPEVTLPVYLPCPTRSTSWEPLAVSRQLLANGPSLQHIPLSLQIIKDFLDRHEQFDLIERVTSIPYRLHLLFGAAQLFGRQLPDARPIGFKPEGHFRVHGAP